MSYNSHGKSDTPGASDAADGSEGAAAAGDGGADLAAAALHPQRRLTPALPFAKPNLYE